MEEVNNDFMRGWLFAEFLLELVKRDENGRFDKKDIILKLKEIADGNLTLARSPEESIRLHEKRHGTMPQILKNHLYQLQSGETFRERIKEERNVAKELLLCFEY